MTDKLTGRTRYRPHKPWIGRTRLILQVEVTNQTVSSDPTDYATYTHTSWRDARVEDLPCLGS
jgi:hypothetical protein